MSPNLLPDRRPQSRSLPLTLLYAVLLCGSGAYAQGLWEPLSPGAGGQTQDLYFDPYTEGRIWISSDQESSYRSDDYGESWQFVGRDLSHGMSFKIRRDNTPGGRLYQVGLWGAHYSDDEGANWTRIAETRGEAIATIEIAPDNQTVVLAPSWHAKDPQLAQESISDPIQNVLGERRIFLSRDGGDSFDAVTFEPAEGYRQVYNAHIDDDTGIIYLGAAAGFYRSTDATGSSFVRVDNPADAYGGPRGGVASIQRIKPDGSVDINGWRRSGGCNGMEFSPDGERVYAVYQTSETTWAMYTTTTANLADASSPQWEKISDGLPDVTEWFNPVVDPRSGRADGLGANAHAFVVGSTFLRGDNRAGLWQATVNLTAGGAVADYAYEQILAKGGEFTFPLGWEDNSLISRAYDYTPLTWSQRRIVAGGGNNFFLSKDIDAADFPLGPDAWDPIYTRVSPRSSGPEPTYSTRGYTNTVTYDIATRGSYAIQGNADQGVLESWDGGVSWTKNTLPLKVSNAQSTAITNTAPAIVMVDTRSGFGIASQTSTFLRARILNSTTQQEDINNWRLIGGGDDQSTVVNGLANRQIQGITVGERYPSRVYLGLRTTFGVGGVWATEEIEEVFRGRASWREISTVDMRGQSSFKDVHVDPNDPNVLWAGARNLYRGTRVGPYEWTWEELRTDLQDMYVWDDGGRTVVAIAAKLSGDGEAGVYLLRNTGAGAWNADGNLVDAGLTIARTLEIRPEAWVEPGETIAFSAMAGYGNRVIVGTENGKHKKGLGMFAGDIGDGGQVTWSDFTADAGGVDLIYPRDNSADAKVLLEANGDVNYYIPTFGTGIWRRRLDAGVEPPSASRAIRTLSTSAFRYGAAPGESREVDVAVSGSWEVANLPSWLTVDRASGSGPATLSFTAVNANGQPAPRVAEVALRAGGEEVLLLHTQAGRPATFQFVTAEIAVDGDEDAAWSEAEWNAIDVDLAGAASGTDRFRVGYTRDNLYVLAEVADATPRAADGITVGLDVNDNKLFTIGASDYRLAVSPDGVVRFDTSGPAVDVDVAATRTAGGYRYELAIAWESLGTLPSAGSALGFEIQTADDQSGDAKAEHLAQWASRVNLATSNPVDWGTGVLEGPDLPWFESFALTEGATVDGGGTAWSVNAPDNGGVFAVSKKQAFQARKLKGEAVWTSEVLDISGAEFVNVSLQVLEKGDNAREGNYLRAYAIADGGEEVLFAAVEQDAELDNEFFALGAEGFSGNSLQLVLRVNNDRNGTLYEFDDVVVDFGNAETCDAPASTSVEAVSDFTTDVAWVAPLGSAAGFELRYRPAGGGDYRTLTTGGVLTAQFAELTPNTTYEWAVRRRCVNSSSEWTAGARFTTIEERDLETVYYESFDAADCEGFRDFTVDDYPCYVAPAVTYAGTAVFDSPSDSSFGYPNASAGRVLLVDTTAHVFEVSGIDVSGIRDAVFSFGILKNGIAQDGSDLSVELLDGDAVIGSVPVVLRRDSTSKVWTFVSAPSELAIPFTTALGIRIGLTGDSRYRFDDLQITGEVFDGVFCAEPKNPTATATGATTAALTWGGSSAAEGFQVRFRSAAEQGFSAPVDVQGASFAFAGLAPATRYVAQVRATCPAGENSAWARVTFATESGDPDSGTGDGDDGDGDGDGDDGGDAGDGGSTAEVIRLRLSPECSADPATAYEWSVNNRNDFAVDAYWEASGTDLTATFVAQPGETTLTTPAESGPYTLTVFWTDGDGVLRRHKKDAIGGVCTAPRRNVQPLADVLLYPNPVDFNLTVEVPASDGTTVVSISDQVGREVKSLTVAGANQIVIPVTDLVHGFYTVTVVQGQRRVNHRLRVE